jgi:ATP-binding cassette subfamily B protein
VSFGFSDSGRRIINDVNFEVKPGQKAALVGKVGSGKSWIAGMIPRYVDPTEGSILLDGHDIRQYRLDELRKIIGYVPQEPALFSDSIEGNIVFGRPGISGKDIEWAVEISQLKDEIESFPGGIKTRIGTRGTSLSGGQKQRLALARALAGKPRILILDDCTSSLDSDTENALRERLAEALPDLTIIFITHRPDVLESTDIILVFESGTKIESGDHHELMRRNGHYARLYKRFQLEQQVHSAV